MVVNLLPTVQVQEQDPPVLAQEDVAGLHVAMDNAVRMQPRQGFQQHVGDALHHLGVEPGHRQGIIDFPTA